MYKCECTQHPPMEKETWRVLALDWVLCLQRVFIPRGSL